jgi:hypothetical protein
MNPPALDTSIYLAAQAIVGPLRDPVDWAVFVGREPLAPNNCVTCYDTGGATNILVDLRAPTIQVRVRSKLYSAGWIQSDAIFQALVQPIQIAVTGGTVLQWVASSDVAFIGRDDSDRPLFTMNFTVLRSNV